MALTQSLIGLFGASLLVVRGASALAPTRRRRLFAVVVLGVALLPVAGIPVAGFIRGFTGDLSITTIVLLVLAGLGRPTGGRPERIFVLAAGAFLYPASLGIGPVDTYALGFAPTELLLVLALIVLMAWWCRSDVLFLSVVAVVTAYGLELMESRNLWDYVVDPWLVLYAIYDLRPKSRKT